MSKYTAEYTKLGHIECFSQGSILPTPLSPSNVL